MIVTILQLKEAHISTQIHLVENTGLLSHSGILFLALLFPHEMTLTSEHTFLYLFLTHCLQEPGGPPCLHYRGGVKFLCGGVKFLWERQTYPAATLPAG